MNVSLYCADNRLKYLPDGLFDALHKLERLEVDDNYISTIKANTFTHLSHLSSLHLAKNQVRFQIIYKTALFGNGLQQEIATMMTNFRFCKKTLVAFIPLL